VVAHKQSRINTGADGTLAWDPVCMGLKRWLTIYFSGALIYLNLTKPNMYKVQKNMGITLKKISRGPKNFSARALKFLHPALPTNHVEGGVKDFVTSIYQPYY
jgi:hypothetical protein